MVKKVLLQSPRVEEEASTPPQWGPAPPQTASVGEELLAPKERLGRSRPSTSVVTSPSSSE